MSTSSSREALRQLPAAEGCVPIRSLAHAGALDGHRGASCTPDVVVTRGDAAATALTLGPQAPRSRAWRTDMVATQGAVAEGFPARADSRAPDCRHPRITRSPCGRHEAPLQGPDRTGSTPVAAFSVSVWDLVPQDYAASADRDAQGDRPIVDGVPRTFIAVQHEGERRPRAPGAVPLLELEDVSSPWLNERARRSSRRRWPIALGIAMTGDKRRPAA